jgi:hypothetical protein
MLFKNTILILQLFIGNTGLLYAQNNIKGQWYSTDSSRQYIISEGYSGIEATMEQSQRAADTIGSSILKNVRYHSKKKYFTAYIYANKDKIPYRAKLFLQKNNSILKIKIRRLVLFPVTIYWHRKV